MPRARRHPLTQAVRLALRDPRGPTARRYLGLLDRRLAALEAGRPVRSTNADQMLARLFLAPLEGAWDDGDENLVRGHLDRWLGAGENAESAARESLLGAARALGAIHARPGTLWFFLWELESMLAGLAETGRSTAHKHGRDARISFSRETDSRRSLMAKRILVVDDDENILNLEKTILEQKGFEVTSAGGGAQALKILAERTFDLILLDVMMPEVDGFTVCRRIKEDSRLKDIPVIFLTAKGGGEALAEGFESGAVMYINKPFTANKLLTIVNTMLESGTNLS